MLHMKVSSYFTKTKYFFRLQDMVGWYLMHKILTTHTFVHTTSVSKCHNIPYMQIKGFLAPHLSYHDKKLKNTNFVCYFLQFNFENTSFFTLKLLEMLHLNYELSKNANGK